MTDRYEQPVSFGEHRMMLRPRGGCGRKLLEASVATTPGPPGIRRVHDVFGNCVAIPSVKRVLELLFESVIRLDLSPTNSLHFQIGEYAKRYPFSNDAAEMADLLRSIERQCIDLEQEIDVSGSLCVPEDCGPARAWLVYLPGGVRIEFGPRNGIAGKHGLIRVAVGRDPRRALPVSRTWTGFASDALGSGAGHVRDGRGLESPCMQAGKQAGLPPERSKATRHCAAAWR